ncbi:EamA family transporter [Rhodocytophaga rosea]|uniref:EamA family transporter n=1 Tax=Rhodocytophaga rosea TaxID=2704465 RepID=A0A6C0GCR0_9BACT|nr:EamA family transporter [Rhodocytophaga rosea]QHT65634.1 EamA family transporter [Rhodocytophaga rosea]
MQTITATKHSLLKLVAAFAAVYIIWGSTYLGVRFASETIPPLLMASVRFLVSGSILYIVARAKGASAPQPIHWRSSAITGFFLLLLGNGLMAWSLKFVASSMAAILVATEPFWLVLVAWLLFGKGKPAIKEVLGLVIGFAGIMILISAGNHSGSTVTNPIGVIMVMVSAIAWAIGSMYATKAVNTDSSILTVAMQMLAGGVMLVIAGTLVGEWKLLHFDAVTAKSLIALAYLTFFGSLVAFTAYSWLLGKVSPSLASTYAFVNPVVAIFLGWSWGGEAISGAMLLASGIIITSVILITQAKHK